MKRSVYDTTIDPNRLDVEQVINVEMIRHWNKQIATLTKERDRLKNEIKFYEANQRLFFSKKAERNPSETRYTDKLADASTTVSVKYQQLQEDLLEANYQLSKAYGYKEAWAARGSALDNLQKLFLHNYYAETRYVKREIDTKACQESASEMLDSAIKRKKKKSSKSKESKR